MNLESIFDRIAEVEGFVRNKTGKKVSNESKTAAALDVPMNRLTNWKNRGKIPWEELYNYSIKKNISFEWLITGTIAGEPPQKIGPINTNILKQIIEAVDEALLERGLESSPDKKAEFIVFLYEYFVDSDQEVNKEKVVRHLRLVA